MCLYLSANMRFYHDGMISLQHRLNKMKEKTSVYNEFIWIEIGSIKIAYPSGFVFSGGANLFQANFLDLVYLSEEDGKPCIKTYSELTPTQRADYKASKSRFKEITDRLS